MDSLWFFNGPRIRAHLHWFSEIPHQSPYPTNEERRTEAHSFTIHIAHTHTHISDSQ